MDREGGKKSNRRFHFEVRSKGAGTFGTPLRRIFISKPLTLSLSPSTGVTGDEEKRVVVNVLASLVDCA